MKGGLHHRILDQHSGTGFDTSFLMLNFNETIGVKNVVLIISIR
jgi:hypothetical protein